MVPSINSYPDQCLAHPLLSVFEYIYYINQERCYPATNVPFHSMIIWFALTFKILIFRHDWESALYQPYGWFGFWPWLVGLPTKFPDIYPKWSQNFTFHCIHLLWSAGKGQFTCLNRNLQGLGIGLVCLSYILCYEKHRHDHHWPQCLWFHETPTPGSPGSHPEMRGWDITLWWHVWRLCATQGYRI